MKVNSSLARAVTEKKNKQGAGRIWNFQEYLRIARKFSKI